ncbi:VWA domain-containing protein [Akkermansiaceae bacterium]|nr:VWA domain-containing protein [Akkermansiaceae bacterium]
MNDDNFIDQALKEHARLEVKDDQAFLDQLEEALDENQQQKMMKRKTKLRKRKSPVLAIAALALVSGAALAIVLINNRFRNDVDGNFTMVESVAWSAEEAPAIQSEPAGPQSSMAKSIPKDPNLEGDRMSLRDASAEVKKAKKGEVLPIPAGSQTRSKPMAPRPLGPTTRPAKSGGKSDKYSRGNRMLAEGFGGDSAPVPGKPRSRLPEAESGERYGQLIETSFLSSLQAPLSTFSTDVDTASYTNIRRHVLHGQTINPNAVRIEEMINYFDYSYPQPEGEHPFAVHTEVASCPWNEKHRLVKIGLQGQRVDQGERMRANLVFLLDVSGSMSNADRLPLLVQSFELLLRQLNEDDRVSIVVYAGRQAVLLDPTAIDEGGRLQVSKALQNLSAGGSTNGAAGITRAYELARRAFIPGGVNRIILATDGDFNVGATSPEALLELVKKQSEANISLTVLGFGQGNLNDELIEKLTNGGDGNYYYIDSLREGQKVFQSGLTGTIQTIAKDVKIQVEFNPGKVAHYRLIGYANRRLRDEDFKNDKIDAGDIGAGHRVTAFYEIIPTGVDTAKIPDGLKYQKEKKPVVVPREIVDSPEMLTVKLRYKQPDGDVSTELAQTLTDKNGSWSQASEDFRFSSGVALWGMLLRDSKHTGSGNSELVTKLALSAKGDDEEGQRTEFLDLLRRWAARR